MTTPPSFNRRSFLKLGCLTATASGAAICGLIAATPDPPPVELVSIKSEGVNMKKRILVAYATCTGSTMDVATAISENLNHNGIQVDVIPVKENPQIGDYQAALIGSAIQYGNWLPEAVDFVKAHHEALNQIPVALFCVHIRNLGEDEASQMNRLAYLDQVRPLLNPVAEGYFAGKFDRRGARLLLPGWLAFIVPSMDFRNWGKISAWADDVSPQLQVPT